MRPLGSAWRCLATVLVVVGVLAGCTVGPNYKRPEVIVPADWRNSPERGDSLGDLGWWELFKDPAAVSSRGSPRSWTSIGLMPKRRWPPPPCPIWSVVLSRTKM